jgi:hypothetical protein
MSKLMEKERFLMMEVFKNHRGERVSVSIEELVLQDHFLRTIEVTIRFHFIEEKLRPYNCENNGRPFIMHINGQLVSPLKIRRETNCLLTPNC